MTVRVWAVIGRFGTRHHEAERRGSACRERSAELLEHRLPGNIAEEFGDRPRKTAERAFVGDRSFFIRHLQRPRIKLRMMSFASCVRHTNAVGFDQVRIDDEIERQSAMPSCKDVSGKVLDPDTRVKQFRLVAGDRGVRIDPDPGPLPQPPYFPQEVSPAVPDPSAPDSGRR